MKLLINGAEWSPVCGFISQWWETAFYKVHMLCPAESLWRLNNSSTLWYVKYTVNLYVWLLVHVRVIIWEFLVLQSTNGNLRCVGFACRDELNGCCVLCCCLELLPQSPVQVGRLFYLPYDSLLCWITLAQYVVRLFLRITWTHMVLDKSGYEAWPLSLVCKTFKQDIQGAYIESARFNKWEEKCEGRWLLA